MSNFLRPMNRTCQASLSITNSRSLPKLMSVESVMPSSHLILCRALLLLPPIEIQPVHSKGDQTWVFIGRTDAEAETPVLWPPHAKEKTHWKRLWCWEGLGAGGEGDDRGWDGWMASPILWTWVWVNSGSWWWTGKPGVLQSMRSQRIGHDWATELNLPILDLFFCKMAISVKWW